MEQKVKKDYLITPVRLSPEVKKRVRLLAAEKDVSMAEMARVLLTSGLETYEETIKKKRKTA